MVEGQHRSGHGMQTVQWWKEGWCYTVLTMLSLKERKTNTHTTVHNDFLKTKQVCTMIS